MLNLIERVKEIVNASTGYGIQDEKGDITWFPRDKAIKKAQELWPIAERKSAANAETKTEL